MSSSARPNPAPPYVTPTAPPWSVLALLPRPFWPWLKNYFGYATSLLTLGASSASTASIQIQGDAWFVALAATMYEYDTSASPVLLPSRPITVQIYDTASGSNWFSQAIAADEFFGDAMQPGLLAFPYICKPNTQLQVTLTNLEAVARNVRLTFHGFKANPRMTEDQYPTGV